MTSKDRQRQLERERYERVQARMAEQRAAAKKRNIITAGVAAVAVVGIGVGVAVATSGSSSKTPPVASPATSAAPSASSSSSSSAPPVAIPIAGCTAAPSIKNPDLTWPKEPAMTIDATKNYTMTLKTNCGDIVIKLNAAKAPHTVNSFSFLAAEKFFDGSFCHRLATGAGLQMLQCGDPKAGATPTATDGQGTPGYTIPDENLTGATYPAGTVAMGNTGAPNSGGAQFFLVYGDASGLGPSYTPFGTITSGLDILKNVAAAGISNPGQDGTGRPNQPVELESVTVTAS